MGLQDNSTLDAKDLGARIREARERIGMSQEGLAQAVSKDQGAISEYESGKRRLAAVDLPDFARALQVSLLYFYQGDMVETDIDRRLLEEFQQIPTLRLKESAIELVRVFSEAVNTHS